MNDAEREHSFIEPDRLIYHPPTHAQGDTEHYRSRNTTPKTTEI